MIIKESLHSVRQLLLREKALVILRENRKLILRFILTALFVYMAAWFIIHEKSELSNAATYIRGANALWVIAGLILAAVYIVLRGLMYVTSFSSISINITLKDAVVLFLKRNFISVFLPAGGVSSLVFFTSNVERKGVTKSQIYFASSINAFAGILTVVIVAIPAFLFFVTAGTGIGKWIALGGVVLILLSFIAAFHSLVKKGTVFKLACRLFPGWQVIIEDMSNHRIMRAPFIYTILLSIIVELTGIAHVYISMTALGISPSLSVSIISYIVVVIFMVISPFLRGLGAIEVSMSYMLIQYGFSNAEAISITLLFRFFEFWVPLFAGMLSFLHRMEKLFLRILPAILIFSLGIVNIISVLTPALPERMKLLRDFLFMDVISFSNSFVLVTGLLLMLTAAFMLKGLRTSWWFALLLSAVSVIGHIMKGIDYEESLIATVVIGSLLATRREYYIRSDPGSETWDSRQPF